EVFSTLGKAGGCASAQLEAISRLVSLALRSGIEIAAIVKQLKGIRCPSIAWEEGKAVLSCGDAIASVLEKQINGEAPALVADAPAKPVSSGPVKNIAGQCPDCGSLLAYEEGCFKCRACGFTRC
ncbi:MAG: TSCPD domain-containing protein, partial [Dehalococcoidales bacterium]|nr:TSCPD domain-containing protein [Dehalococcoidales bacterium]